MKNPNELSATSSWRGNELQLIEQKANIVVGVANSRTRLRIGVLLSKYSEYQVDYISSESEIGKLIEEADLIIGAGLFVDNEVGAATATGHGEEVIRTCGSHLVVELMRQGKSPQQACEEAVKRIYKNFVNQNRNVKDTQIGFIAINKFGETGAFCLQKGFNYAVHTQENNVLIDAKSLI